MKINHEIGQLIDLGILKKKRKICVDVLAPELGSFQVCNLLQKENFFMCRIEPRLSVPRHIFRLVRCSGVVSFLQRPESFCAYRTATQLYRFKGPALRVQKLQKVDSAGRYSPSICGTAATDLSQRTHLTRPFAFVFNI